MSFIIEESQRIVGQYYDIVLHYLQIEETNAKYIFKKRNNKEHVFVPEPFRITHLPTTKFVEMLLRLLHVADYAYLFRTRPASPEAHARQIRAYKSLPVAISCGHMLCDITT